MKKKWLVLCAVAVVYSFLSGMHIGSTYTTLLHHPILTIRAMRVCPIGTEVVIADNVDEDMIPYFAERGLGKDVDKYGIVVGYTITRDSDWKLKLNYRIRTGAPTDLDNAGGTDPSLVRPLPGHHRIVRMENGSLAMVYDPNK
jgi:hypothetical protein